jgi:hypothetical protein
MLIAIKKGWKPVFGALPAEKWLLRVLKIDEKWVVRPVVH